VTDGEARALLRSVADGRVLSGRQALDVGLVDELGGQDEAIDAAVRLSGAKGRYVVRGERRRRDPSWLDYLGGMLHAPDPSSLLPGRNRISLQYILR